MVRCPAIATVPRCAGERRGRVVAGSPAQVGGPRALDEHVLDADRRDPDPPQRIAGVAAAAERPGGERQPAALVQPRQRAPVDGGQRRLLERVELVAELVLLVAPVQRRDRLLPQQRDRASASSSAPTTISTAGERAQRRASSPQRRLGAAERARPRVARGPAGAQPLRLGASPPPCGGPAGRSPARRGRTATARGPPRRRARRARWRPPASRASASDERIEVERRPRSARRPARAAPGRRPPGRRRRARAAARTATPANSHRCAAGSSSAAAYGLNSHTTAVRTLTTSPRAAAEPARRGAAAGRQPADDQRAQPEPADGGDQHRGGRWRSRRSARRGRRRARPAWRARRAAPVSASTRSHSHASSGASAPAASQAAQRPAGSLRRRARNQASTAVSSAGSRSVPTSIRTAQSGSTLRIVTMPCGPREKAADTAARESSDRPRDVDRGHRAQHAAPERAEPGPRDGLVRRGRAARPWCRRLHGRQALGADHALPGDRQRDGAAHPLAGGAGAAGVRRHLAAQRRLDRPLERQRRGRRARDHGTTHGLRIRSPAMFPSTSTASIGSSEASLAPMRARPRSRSCLPDVETRTSVLRRSRWRNSRASSSSVAVADSSARPGVRDRVAAGHHDDPPARDGPAARRPRSPGRPRRTPRAARHLEGAAARARGPAGRGWPPPGRRGPRRPSRRARRSGNVRASSLSEFRCGRASSPNATRESNASAASGEVAGAGRSASENAAMNTATSAGRKAHGRRGDRPPPLRYR